VVFGELVSGHDLLTQIEKLETDETDKPVLDCRISHCGILVRKTAAVKKSKKSKKSRRKRSHSSDGQVEEGENKKVKEVVEEEEEELDQGVMPPGEPDRNWLDRTGGRGQVRVQQERLEPRERIGGAGVKVKGRGDIRYQRRD
jgi:hypothetical protein